jgi:hypothetical protein
MLCSSHASIFRWWSARMISLNAAACSCSASLSLTRRRSVCLIAYGQALLTMCRHPVSLSARFPPARLPNPALRTFVSAWVSERRDDSEDALPALGYVLSSAANGGPTTTMKATAVQLNSEKQRSRRSASDGQLNICVHPQTRPGAQH